MSHPANPAECFTVLGNGAKQTMARGATLFGKNVFLWERFSASIIAAGKPLPQKRHSLLDRDFILDSSDMSG
jgi:hypothetical protein